MKPKQWASLLKPLAQKVIEIGDSTDAEAQKAYEDWAAQANSLRDECYEIITMRMKNFNPSIRKFGKDHSADRLTNAIREASVKYSQVYALLSQELGVDILPFPMLKAAMFLPTVFGMKKLWDEEKLSVIELQEMLTEIKGMAKNLLFEDDPFVNKIFQYCDSIISSRKQTEYIQDITQLSDIISSIEQSENNGGLGSTLKTLSRNPKAVALARRINSYMRQN